MLSSLILIITIGAADVSAMEQAYSQWLGYSTVERGDIDKSLAATWGAPRMAGRKYVLMQPESKAGIYLRFVEVAEAPGYKPMQTFGWNAVEMLVQDPDQLEQKLAREGSPFQIVGRPRPLGPNSPIRAMQVVGPAKEVVYLTRIPPDQNLVRQTARTFVDRPFIMVLGGPSLEDLRKFYSSALGLQVGTSGRTRMTVLNKTHGLDIETTHPVSMARVSPDYSLELDGYPETATARPVRPGELPPSIAMVSIEVPSLDRIPVPLDAPARRIGGALYRDRRVGVLTGPAGERLELIETGR